MCIFAQNRLTPRSDKGQKARRTPITLIFTHQCITHISHNLGPWHHFSNHFDYSIISGTISLVYFPQLRLMFKLTTMTESIVLHQHHVTSSATNHPFFLPYSILKYKNRIYTVTQHLSFQSFVQLIEVYLLALLHQIINTATGLEQLLNGHCAIIYLVRRKHIITRHQCHCGQQNQEILFHNSLYYLFIRLNSNDHFHMYEYSDYINIPVTICYFFSCFLPFITGFYSTNGRGRQILHQKSKKN